MSAHGESAPAVYGVLAEFDHPDKLVEAAAKASMRV